EVMRGVDAKRCMTEPLTPDRSTMKLPYSPNKITHGIQIGFEDRDWSEPHGSPSAPRDGLRSSSPRTSFTKERVGIEIQIGKNSFVALELFARHMAFFVGDVIDVGVEILPMKELQQEMSSGVAYYEGELYNLIREGRGVPAVPLVLIGVAP
ncbi:MAG: restriction endonuclease, partial [Methylocystis sp.]|nr:restriction endonuclease [Methylocystis sp.]